MPPDLGACSDAEPADPGLSGGRGSAGRQRPAARAAVDALQLSLQPDPAAGDQPALRADIRGPAGGPAARGTALCRCTGAARGACLREGGAMAVPGSRGDAEGIAQCWRRLLDGSISTTVVPALVAGAHWHQGVATSCHHCISTSRKRPTLERQGLQTAGALGPGNQCRRSEEHTSELQSLMRPSYAVFCLK